MFTHTEEAERRRLLLSLHHGSELDLSRHPGEITRDETIILPRIHTTLHILNKAKFQAKFLSTRNYLVGEGKPLITRHGFFSRHLSLTDARTSNSIV